MSVIIPHLLTEEQHALVLLVHGNVPHEWTTPGPTQHWSGVFHWIKSRWPGLVTCASYAYILNNWRDRLDAESDMNVMVEIHKYQRELRRGQIL